MATISALRHEGVGNDTYAYIYKFEDFSMTWSEIFNSFLLKYLSPSNDIGKDPGADILMKLLSFLTSDGRYYIAIVSFITIGSISSFIYKNANNMKTALFSFIFFIVMFYHYIPNSALRQSLALSCLLFAYSFLNKKKITYFIIIVLIASTFHKSALCGLLLLALMYIDKISIVYKISLIGFLGVLMFPEYIAEILGGSSDIYSEYAVGSYYQRASKPYMVILLILILYVICWMILLKDKECENKKMLYYGSTLTFLFTPLIWADPSTLRLLSYFGLFMPILLGNYIHFIPNSQMMFKIIILIFVFKAAISSDNFRFMWQYMELHERYGYISPKYKKDYIKMTQTMNNNEKIIIVSNVYDRI